MGNKHRYDRLTLDVCNYDQVAIGDEIYVTSFSQFEHCLQNKDLQRKIVFKGIRKLIDDNLNQFTVFSIVATHENKTLEILLNSESATLTLEEDLKESLKEENYDRCVIIRDLLKDLYSITPKNKKQ